MATERSADEAKQEYVKAMGDELGSLFHTLWQETAWLHRKWHEYVELFGTKESRIDLVNSAAPRFFRIVEDALWDDALLHITRLTEPPKVNRRTTITIQRLHPLIRDAAVAATVKASIDKALDVSAFCRDWRNRRIAHHDSDLALNPRAVPLAPASRESIRLALASIVDVLNSVSMHYLKGTSIFDWQGYPGGAESLLHIIDDGVRASEDRIARLSSGEFSAGDLQPRDI